MAKADLEKAKALYPSCAMGAEAWSAFFATPAGMAAMGRILYDIYDEILSREERETGQRRIGRRPAREAVSLAKVMAVVRPEEFSLDPLPITLNRLLRGRSQRHFARKVPISQPHLNRLLKGNFASVDIDLLEQLAAAAEVQPWHFAEWRALFVGSLITEVMHQSPHVGITVLRGLRENRRAFDAGLAAPKSPIRK